MSKFDRTIVMGMFKVIVQGLLWLLSPDRLNPGHRVIFQETCDEFLDDPLTREWMGGDA